jgi:hypothetical protein
MQRSLNCLRGFGASLTTDSAGSSTDGPAIDAAGVLILAKRICIESRLRRRPPPATSNIMYYMIPALKVRCGLRTHSMLVLWAQCA